MARGYLGNLGRYVVFRGHGHRASSGPLSMPIAGLYARGFDAAEKLAEELFGVRQVTVDRFRVKSGWTDDGGLFLTKSSGRGCTYMCKACGREHLGRGAGHNHHAWCVYSVRSSP
jgi:hypothetical protein